MKLKCIVKNSYNKVTCSCHFSNQVHTSFVKDEAKSLKSQNTQVESFKLTYISDCKHNLVLYPNLKGFLGQTITSLLFHQFVKRHHIDTISCTGQACVTGAFGGLDRGVRTGPWRSAANGSHKASRVVFTTRAAVHPGSQLPQSPDLIIVRLPATEGATRSAQQI